MVSTIVGGHIKLGLQRQGVRTRTQHAITAGYSLTILKAGVARREPSMPNNQRPTLCIYHGHCADGFGAAWVVRKALGPDIEFHAGI